MRVFMTAFVLVFTAFEALSLPLHCPEFSATFYTAADKSPDAFPVNRCRAEALELKKLGIQNLTFVFEHYGFDLDIKDNYRLYNIPSTAVSSESLENCF